MKIKELKLYFIIGYIITIIVLLGFPLISKRISSEKFFSLAILGQDRQVDQYFSRNNPTINVGQKLNWTIYVSNNYDKINYVSIHIKMVNKSIPNPNSFSCDPCPSNTIYEFNRFVEKDQEIYIPFTWSLLNYEIVNERTGKLDLLINNNTVSDLSFSGSEFRFVFELWVFNEDSNDFKFAWINEDLTNQCVWNQIWFNISRPIM